jgi:hypothetical protein
MYPRTEAPRLRTAIEIVVALVFCLAFWAGIVYALAVIFDAG